MQALGMWPATAFVVGIVAGACDHHENGKHANGAGQARTEQPAEAAALTPVGVIAAINVVERPAGAS